MRPPFGALICAWLSIQDTWARPVLEKRMADFESVRTRLDRSYVDPDLDHPFKYFHESKFHPHYDGRFADKPLKYDDKQAHLKALIQTYLMTMNDIGAETWLMHGSLLGWYWNRKVMPWDTDLDVMLSERSLHFLAHYHNMTMHTFRLPRQFKTRTYMLEINPHWSEGELDAENRIDARWIDTETGLFIDITTLRRDKSAASAVAGDEAMMVKDKHHYLFDDIYPLRESTFEGVPARVPFAYPEILVEEYGDDALSGVNYQQHRFDKEKGAWMPQAVISDAFGNEEEEDEGE